MEFQIVMSSKDRLLSAINGQKPDRLPVVTHHVMPSFLNNCLGGASEELFFDHLKRVYDSVGRAVDFGHDNEISKVEYYSVKSGPKPGCLT